MEFSSSIISGSYQGFYFMINLTTSTCLVESFIHLALNKLYRFIRFSVIRMVEEFVKLSSFHVSTFVFPLPCSPFLFVFTVREYICFTFLLIIDVLYLISESV